MWLLFESEAEDEVCAEEPELEVTCVEEPAPEEAPEVDEEADPIEPLSEEDEDLVPAQETMTERVKTEAILNSAFFFIGGSPLGRAFPVNLLSMIDCGLLLSKWALFRGSLPHHLPPHTKKEARMDLLMSQVVISSRLRRRPRCAFQRVRCARI